MEAILHVRTREVGVHVGDAVSVVRGAKVQVREAGRRSEARQGRPPMAHVGDAGVDNHAYG
eukprot:10269066-Lingulodinium_polyedra.AAC.1